MFQVLRTRNLDRLRPSPITCLNLPIAALAREIRIADVGFRQPERVAAGGYVVVRAAWRNGRWLDLDGTAVDFVVAFAAAREGRTDRPLRLGRTGAKPQGTEPLKLRLVAARLPLDLAQAARARARRAAQKRGGRVSDATLVAAEWVVLATSLDAAAFPTAAVLALCRLRWRIELAFKRLKSVIGLQGPPGTDRRSVRAFVLTHLLTNPPLEFDDRLVRGLFLLDHGRLTRPGVWRLMRQLLATVMQAIAPQPQLRHLRRRWTSMRRNMHEPPMSVGFEAWVLPHFEVAATSMAAIALVSTRHATLHVMQTAAPLAA